MRIPTRATNGVTAYTQHFTRATMTTRAGEWIAPGRKAMFIITHANANPTFGMRATRRPATTRAPSYFSAVMTIATSLRQMTTCARRRFATRFLAVPRQKRRAVHRRSKRIRERQPRWNHGRGDPMAICTETVAMTACTSIRCCGCVLTVARRKAQIMHNVVGRWRVLGFEVRMTRTAIANIAHTIMFVAIPTGNHWWSQRSIAICNAKVRSLARRVRQHYRLSQ